MTQQAQHKASRSGSTGWDRAEKDRPRIERVEESSGDGGEGCYSQGGPRIERVGVEESSGGGGESCYSGASMEAVPSDEAGATGGTSLLRPQEGFHPGSWAPAPPGPQRGGGIPVSFIGDFISTPCLSTLEVLQGACCKLQAICGEAAPEGPLTHTYTWRPPPPLAQPDEPNTQACLSAWKQGSKDDSPEWRWPSRRDPGQLVPTHNLLGQVVGGSGPISAADPTELGSTCRSYPVTTDERQMIERWMANSNGVTFEAAWRLAGAVVPLPDRPTMDKCARVRPRLVGFHGTSRDAIVGIVQHGFAAPTKRGLLGKRVYLSPDCSKAAHYSATKYCDLLLVCHFDPGDMLVVGEAQDRDSSNGWTGGEGEGWDTVKGIPPFIRVTPAEYGVKEPRRISPAYVLQFNHPNFKG